MAWTQSDSNVFHLRLRNVARTLVDLDAEMERLLSLAASEDLGVNLDDASDGSVTAEEGIALNGVVQSYRSWVTGFATVADDDRRDKLDAYLVTAIAGTTTE